MSDVASIESGILAPDLREALRTLLSRKSEPYLEFPSTADAPGVCICTSYADVRRTIVAEYESKVNSRLTVPPTYCAGGGRRKLPDGLPPAEEGSKRRYVEAGTQTEAGLRSTASLSQVESAAESTSHRRKILRKATVSRAICSSTDTESAGNESVGVPGTTVRSPQPVGSQGLSSLPRCQFCHTNGH